MLILEIAYLLSVWVVPVLLAITMHEAAHGYVAWRLGDPTAMRAGRVTANPLKHIDPVGTLLLPGLLLLVRAPFLFGFAKPVPVDFSKLRKPKRDMVLVAIAGPASNLLLAILSALLIGLESILPASAGLWLVSNLENSIIINLLLAIFNLIPLPPLDGGRVAVGLLPRSLGWRLAKLEKFGLFILLGLLFIVPMLMKEIGVVFDPLHWLLIVPVQGLFDLLRGIIGVP
ncbi:MAG: site-2 protease family protein [Rhodospirillaceae bacterium]|nr:site-2 protease family protein [Rhodospirillaceae bacterium]